MIGCKGCSLGTVVMPPRYNTLPGYCAPLLASLSAHTLVKQHIRNEELQEKKSHFLYTKRYERVVFVNLKIEKHVASWQL